MNAQYRCVMMLRGGFVSAVFGAGHFIRTVSERLCIEFRPVDGLRGGFYKLCLGFCGVRDKY